MRTLKITTKTKKEIRYFANLVLMLIASMCLLASLTSCKKSCSTDPVKDCGTPATVRDLRGLDGCSFVLELPSGQRLEPVKINSVNSALTNFIWKDGQRVTIAYQEVNGGVSTCMVGKLVEVTCIAPNLIID